MSGGRIEYDGDFSRNDDLGARVPGSEPIADQPPVEVPMEVLQPELLTAVIESFILREGTDYGAAEIALDTKIRQVAQQLEKGKVKIVFDPNTESVTLMTALEWEKLSRS